MSNILSPVTPDCRDYSAQAFFPATVKSPTAETGQPYSEKNQHFAPRENVKRPPGDIRTAEQIINDNPVLKMLDSQKGIRRYLVYTVNGETFVKKPQHEKNIYVELAYDKLGNWTSSNPDPVARADAAYNAARVLNWIDSSLTATGQSRGKEANNGVLEGFTRSGYALDGTPARMWQAFAEDGYGALSYNHRLAHREDGPLTQGPHPHWTDRRLIGQVAEHFREFATGANDRFVNVNELKEAAGLVPSSRTFSAQAQEVALELLARPELLRELDIGIGDYGPGKEDNRFDQENIAYLYSRASDVSPLHFFRQG